MYPHYTTTKKGVWAYIQKSVRVDGRPKTITVKRLGLLEDIKREQGCADPRRWVEQLAARMTQEEREGSKRVNVELSPVKAVAKGQGRSLMCGDLMLLPLYNSLGLPQVCEQIKGETKARYDLNAILEALVVLRVLRPCSKRGSFGACKARLRKAGFTLDQVYRALSLLGRNVDRIQAAVWESSKKVMRRNTRVIYYDCTNYYFEIEDNDLELPDPSQPGRRVGPRRRGKSKEHRPNPIVQMGLLMDRDGIPLAFVVFPGNESEQPSLQRIEEMVADRFGLNEFVVSTDAGLSSEDNRRYNMTEQREYIAVQSLPGLPEADQRMALDPRGWHVAFRDKDLPPIDPADPARDTFSLDELDLEAERHTRFYKEIIVEKRLDGKASSARPERVIVTYSHDFALYLRHKRQERIKAAEKIVSRKAARSRQTQQDPRRYVKAEYCTADGELAEHLLMHIDQDAIDQEARFDGFYAYGTSLDDDAVDVLRARSFHYEIEHLFRNSKSLFDARPIFLAREDHISAHFLICFLAMTITKMLQRQTGIEGLTLEQLLDTLRSMKVTHLPGYGYTPSFTRTDLTDRLQELANVNVSTEIIPTRTMNKYYRNVKV